VPSARAEETGTDQVPPERVAESVSTTKEPCLITTDTVAESPTAVPAVPEIVGDALFDVDPSAGEVTATPDGADVSTVNVTVGLVPTFVAASDCDAVAV